MTEFILVGLILIFLLLAKVIAFPRRIHNLLSDWRQFQAWRQWRDHVEEQADVQERQEPNLLVTLRHNGPPALLPRCGKALASPPELETAIAYMQYHEPHGRALVPYGWYRHQDTADLVYTDLFEETLNIGIGGLTRHGKTRLVLHMLLSLAEQLPPDRLQWCLFDLKKVDFADLKDKAHTWRLVQTPEEIGPAIEALTQEMSRRATRMAEARVTNWTDYRGSDMPLMVIYVSELSTMKLVMGDKPLNLWLNNLLGTGAGLGLRTLVDTQNFGNYSTHWREQIRDWIIGPLTDPLQDEVNTGLSTKQLLAAHALPPSQIPTTAKGVFTVVSGNRALTVRTSPMTNEARLAWIDRLPVRPDTMILEAPEQVELPAQQDALSVPVSSAEELATVQPDLQARSDRDDTVELTPYELQMLLGFTLEQLRNEPLVASKVLAAWESLPPAKRSGRKLTEFVFDPGEANRSRGIKGFTGSRWEQVVKPILDDLNLKIEAEQSAGESVDLTPKAA